MPAVSFKTIQSLVIIHSIVVKVVKKNRSTSRSSTQGCTDETMGKKIDWSSNVCVSIDFSHFVHRGFFSFFLQWHRLSFLYASVVPNFQSCDNITGVALLLWAAGGTSGACWCKWFGVLFLSLSRVMLFLFLPCSSRAKECCLILLTSGCLLSFLHHVWTSGTYLLTKGFGSLNSGSELNSLHFCSLSVRMCTNC